MAISQSTMDVLARGGSLTAEQQKEIAKHNYETGSSQYLGGSTQFQDPTYGSLDYANVANKDSLEYKLFNPQQQTTAQNTIKQVTDLFTQNVGVAPSQITNGDPLNTITAGAQMGKTAEQIIADLGGWSTWQKFGMRSDLAGGGIQETDAQRMARTGETQAEIDYARSLLPKAQAFAQQLPQPQAPTATGMQETVAKTTLPSVQAPTTITADMAFNSANSSIAQIMQMPTPPKTETDLKQQSILDDIAKLTGDYANKAAEQLTAEQSAGLPQLRSQFADINAKLVEKSAEMKALDASYGLTQAQTEGKVVSLARMAGQQAQDYRNYVAQKNAIAAEAGLLQAQALGLQGRIEDAQATVNRAIDLKYSVIENRLNVYQAQLNALQPELNRQEKQQALAQQLLLDERSRVLSEQKASEKQIQGLMLDAASKGASAQILSSISNSTSLLQATQAYSNFVRSQQATVGGGGDGVGGGVVAPAVQTFEDFIQDKEEELGMSIANREQFRAEYNQMAQQTQLSNISPLAQSVIQNPELFNQLTATEKGRIAPELTSLGFTAFGKPLSDTALKDITQSETALEGLKELKTKVVDNEQYIGPISGLQAYNPWSKARQVQADINRVKQRVGKALEGGVLRKEDEEKYKKILATVFDTPETAIYKINQLISDVVREIETYKRNQALSGRQVNQQVETKSTDPLGIR